ncbi:chemotaxis protein CheX [Pelagirhabdus alkalitolerans]|uniref:Chemotaxis protein CheX n=1 Tax=Pelagirhabdus alkalitolerans TaxID=1612202 RepID=A0A1G6LNV3_9BACI|nr:chemotaxis protein CheX [Pelagirhabdus alkalitolerans]SDC44871.1 chemotaxis protein CheX [Pelagirhabdus alkalitolerans]
MATDKNLNEIIKEVYNGTIHAVKNIIPLDPEVGSPQLVEPPLTVKFGVLIGVTGSIKGELVLQSDQDFFSEIGEVMFGMPLTEDMLESFAGELGNMIAGSLSTYLSNVEINTDITHPTVLQGDATLSGFKRALLVDINYSNQKNLKVHLLLNQ